jgi:heptosyltransferase-1
MQSILIARMSAMGDIVHSLPAVAALRQAFPQAKIGWTIEDRWLELLAARSAVGEPQRSAAKPLVDAIHVVNTKSWRAAPFSAHTRDDIRRTIRELRAHNYQVAVDLQAAIRSAVLNRLGRAPLRFGFAKPRESLAKMFYTSSIETPAVHVVDQGLQLASAIAGRQGLPIEFPLPHDSGADSACRRRLQELGTGEFAIINPGAGWGAKCWPVERYADVALFLAEKNIHALVNCGPGEEALVKQLSDAARSRVHALSCSLSDLIAFIRRARLFIGGDTGPVHLAAALDVPVVAIYGPTDPARNGPYGPRGPNDPKIKVLRSPESETSHARRSAPERGMLQITATEVIEAASAFVCGAS